MTESDNTPVEETTSEAPAEASTNPTPVPDAPGEQEAVSDEDQTEDAVAAAPVSAVPSNDDAVSDNPTQPDYADVPEKNDAEPNDAETTHEATPEQVEGQE